MNCPNCNKPMELEEYYTDFINNEEEIQLREEFWCPHCDKLFLHTVRYLKQNEWVTAR